MTTASKREGESVKSVRQAVIKNIIESQIIETQEDLADALRQQRIKVTQATVSRDIKEMMLIKVSYTAQTRSSLIELCSVMGAKIMHISAKSIMIEIHNTPDVIGEFLDLLKSFGILEVQRTGTISMAKG